MATQFLPIQKFSSSRDLWRVSSGKGAKPQNKPLISGLPPTGAHAGERGDKILKTRTKFTWQLPIPGCEPAHLAIRPLLSAANFTCLSRKQWQGGHDAYYGTCTEPKLATEPYTAQSRQCATEPSKTRENVCPRVLKAMKSSIFDILLLNNTQAGRSRAGAMV